MPVYILSEAGGDGEAACRYVSTFSMICVYHEMYSETPGILRRVNVGAVRIFTKRVEFWSSWVLCVV
jgi:hypothetical protein